MTRVNGCVRRARPQRDAGYPGAFHELFAVLSGSKLGFATQQPPTTQLVTNYSSSTWKGVVAVPHGPRYNRVSARMTTTPRAGARVEEIVHRHVDAQCSTPPSRRICRAPNIWWHSGPRRRPAPTGRVGDSFRMIADPAWRVAPNAPFAGPTATTVFAAALNQSRYLNSIELLGQLEQTLRGARRTAVSPRWCCGELPPGTTRPGRPWRVIPAAVQRGNGCDAAQR